MKEFLDLFRNKKHLISLLLLGILIIALPLGIKLVSQQKIIQSRATNPPIVFKGNNVVQRNGQWIAIKPQISLELTSALGAPASTPVPGASSSPSSSPSLAPSPSSNPNTGDVYFLLDPIQASKTTGDSFNVTLKLNASTFNISALDITVNFDKDKLELINFVPASDSHIDSVINEKNNLSGYFHFVGVRSPATNRVSGEVNLGTIQLKAKNVEGIAQITFGNTRITSSDRSDPLTISNNQGGSYSILNIASATSYRIAENPTDLAAAAWENYNAEPTLRDYEFRDKSPGVKTIFVEFKDSHQKTGGCGVNNSQPCQVQIRLLGDFAIGSCALSFEGNNAVLNLRGQNFGLTRGEIKSGDTDLQVREWKDKNIKAVWQDAPVGQVLPVSVTNTDGQVAESQCSAISQLSVGAKFFCGQSSSSAVNNIDLSLAGVFEGGTKIKQKVSIATDGIIQGLNQKLEEGKNYKVSLKGPKSLRRTAEFTAGNGTTNVTDFVLPVGDIFPVTNGDGVINNFDHSELVRQWIISVDATGRSADFNGDGRVNSIDWACMRHDFGSSDDSEPAAGGPAAAPSASPSPVASDASASSPSPSPSPSATLNTGVGSTAGSTGIGSTAR